MRRRTVVVVVAAIPAILLASPAACSGDRFGGPSGDADAAGSDGGGTAPEGGRAGDDGGGDDSGGGSNVGAEGGVGAACNPFAPCAKGLYCDSSGCGAGSCVATAPSTNNQYVPVCGCDGITYFNSSIAVAAGVSIRTANPCAKNDPATKLCGGLQGDPCPASSKCSMVTLKGGNCSDPAGICVELPTTCPSGPSIHLCGAGCGSVCEAVASETPYYEDTACP